MSEVSISHFSAKPSWILAIQGVRAIGLRSPSAVTWVTLGIT